MFLPFLVVCLATLNGASSATRRLAKTTIECQLLHGELDDGLSCGVRKLLQDAGAFFGEPPTPPTNDVPNETEFLNAVENGDIQTVKRHLENGFNIEATGGNFDYTALLTAAKFGRVDIVRLLKERGADLWAVGSNGFKAIHLAAFFGHPEVLRVLLDQGVNIEERTTNGGTALYLAAQEGQWNAVKFLLDAGADIEGQFSGATPIVVAVQNMRLAVVEELATRGANVNVKGDDGATPLMYAARNEGNSELLFALIDAGADINAQNNFGFTPLYYAAYFGQKSNVEALLSRGGDGRIVDVISASPKDHVCRCFDWIPPGPFCNVNLCKGSGDEIRALFD